ncbi:MAG TPA: hypothetical protein VKX17_03650 [Planctomycetota bacterium]|nr:hypothetical protein [Planctomycetota bacterium]
MRSVFALSFVTLAFFFSSVAYAGGKGKKGNKNNSNDTIEFILEHSADLKLTQEQIQKLQALQAAEEKAMGDPAVVAIMQKVKEARQAGNQAGLAEQRDRLNDKIKLITGGQFGLLGVELNKILTADQQTTLAALRKKNAPKDGAAPADPKAPDKGVNPFDL